MDAARERGPSRSRPRSSSLHHSRRRSESNRRALYRNASKKEKGLLFAARRKMRHEIYEVYFSLRRVGCECLRCDPPPKPSNCFVMYARDFSSASEPGGRGPKSTNACTCCRAFSPENSFQGLPRGSDCRSQAATRKCERYKSPNETRDRQNVGDHVSPGKPIAASMRWRSSLP